MLRENYMVQNNNNNNINNVLKIKNIQATYYIIIM